MLEAKKLNYRYGFKIGKEKDDFEIRDASLLIEPGYVSCLLGKNGAGKTTLLSLLYGMLWPRTGEILWNGTPLTKRNLTAFRREVAYAGESWCIDGLTVKQNVETLSIFYPSFDKEYFENLMRLAGAEGCMEKLVDTLSAGERVKTELSFLLARRPKLLLLDEPLANIDPVFKLDVLELLQKTVAENETGILISTHLVDEISDMVDYVHVMENGSIVESGSRFEVLGEEGGLRDVFAK